MLCHRHGTHGPNTTNARGTTARFYAYSQRGMPLDKRCHQKPKGSSTHLSTGGLFNPRAYTSRGLDDSKRFLQTSQLMMDIKQLLDILVHQRLLDNLGADVPSA